MALGLLAVRIGLTMVQVRRGSLHPFRLVIPLLILAQGCLSLWHAGRDVAPVLAIAIVFELAVLALAVGVLVRARRQPGKLLEDRLADSLACLLPAKLARLVSLEIVLLTAVLSVPFTRRVQLTAGSMFSYSENARLRAVLLAGPLLLLFEGIVIHQWLGPQRFWLRALHLAVCLYVTLWIWGAYVLMRSRPHRIDGDDLCLHRGIWGRLRIPLGEVISVRPLAEGSVPPGLRGTPGIVALTVKGVDQVEITVRTPMTAMGFLGPTKPASKIVLSADDAPAFCRAIERAADRRRLHA